MKKLTAVLTALSLLCCCAGAAGGLPSAENGMVIVSPKDEFDFTAVISEPGWKYEVTEEGIRISRKEEDRDALARIMVASGPADDSGKGTDPRTAAADFVRAATGESDPYIMSWNVNGGYEGVYSHGTVPDTGAVLRAVTWLVGDRLYVAAIYETGEQADAEEVFLNVLDTFKPAPDEPAAGRPAAPAAAAQPDDSRYGKGFIFSVGIDDQFSPFTYKTDGGGYAGFDVEMCEKVAQINGWNLMTLPVEWNSIVSWLDSRRIDCIWSGFTMSDSMKQKGYVSSFAYYDSTVVLLTRADSFIMKPEDLMGCRVAVLSGSYGADFMSEGKGKNLISAGDLTAAPDMASCADLLQTGLADAAVLSRYAAQGMLAADKDFVIRDGALAGGEFVLCFRPGEEALCRKVEDAVMKLVEDGTYEALAKKYGLRTDHLSLLYNK